MNWYLAILLMKSSIDFEEKPLFMEEFVLIQAFSYDEAYAKAGGKGVGLEHSYPNDYGEEVRWTFQYIVEITELFDKQITDGTEIYSRAVPEAPKAISNRELYE